MRNIQTIFFDMDGLLLDSERLCLDVFLQTCTEFGAGDQTAIFMQCIGRTGQGTKDVLQAEMPENIPLENFYREWMDRLHERIKQPIPLKPGAKTLVETLNKDAVPCFVVTSTRTEAAIHHLQLAGIHEFFAEVIGGDQVTNGKPDPEIYLRALAISKMPINNCLAFEDSDNGTRAARSAGLTTVQIPDLKQPDDDVKALGQIIAPDLLTGAHEIGLIS